MTAKLYINCLLNIYDLHFECPHFQDMGVVQLEAQILLGGLGWDSFF